MPNVPWEQRQNRTQLRTAGLDPEHKQEKRREMCRGYGPWVRNTGRTPAVPIYPPSLDTQNKRSTKRERKTDRERVDGAMGSCEQDSGFTNSKGHLLCKI